MHDAPDSDAEDAEFGWENYEPDGFKQLIRERVRRNITQTFTDSGNFGALYRQHYQEDYQHWGEFIRKIGEVIAIGAENGADDALDVLQAALRADAPLPVPTAAKVGPAFDRTTLEEVRQAIKREFGQYHLYEHAFGHYDEMYADYDSFVGQITELTLAGAADGSERMLERVTAAIRSGEAVPRVSRYPRRVCLC